MSRYIDADEYVTVSLYDDEREEEYTERMTIAESLDHFTDEGCPQTIDIVRCKECRYWEMRNSPRGWCVVHQGYVSPQYFCADGERKSDD